MMLKRRTAKSLGVLLVLMPFCALSCSGCRTAFESATWDARPGRLLNGRAAVVYSSRYEIDLWGFEKSHSFDIHKYRRMARALVDGGYLAAPDFFVPGEVSDEMLLSVHTPEYLAKLRSPSNVGRYLENGAVAILPSGTVDDRLLTAFRVTTGGTVLAARLAWQCGLGINLGGGYHHAHADHGEGFCIYADVPIAVRQLQREGLLRRVLLVDLDVHQGNGNARIFAGDRDVFTFSIHQEDLYPKPKATSDLDRGLWLPVDDEAYMEVLTEELPSLLDDHKPELVVVLAGVDTYRGDPLAGFGMTIEGIVARDEYAVGQARRRGIPVLHVTSGGYSQEAWRIQYLSIANLLTKFAGVSLPADRAAEADAAPSKLAPTTAKSAKGKQP
ncbi:MAG: histone deacetylase [Planctomycetes bacterium]|nr:histone deacetylase [Planctomycetota bacterium]